MDGATFLMEDAPDAAEEVEGPALDDPDEPEDEEEESEFFFLVPFGDSQAEKTSSNKAATKGARKTSLSLLELCCFKSIRLRSTSFTSTELP